MTLYTYATCITGFILFTVFMLVCHKKRSVKGVFIKNIVSYFFLFTNLAATKASPENWNYAMVLLLGGVLGLMGDIYLDQKWVYPNDKDKYLLYGFISFGVGHLFYIRAMAVTAELVAKDFVLPLIFGIVVAGGNLIISKPLNQDFGKFKAVVTAYGFILSFMAATATISFMKTKSIGFLMFAIAGFLFLVSDVILSAMYFTVGKDKNTVPRFVLNHATYYAAQYLIALTPLFIGVSL